MRTTVPEASQAKKVASSHVLDNELAMSMLVDTTCTDCEIAAATLPREIS